MQKPGALVEESGIYWCTVCKLPVQLEKGQTFPHCANKCGRGRWDLVKQVQAESTKA